MTLALEDLSSMENRKYGRVPSRIRCWCEGENITLYSRVGNLSEGGLFLRTSTPLQAGTRTTVRLGAGEESGSELHALAKVVWTRKNGLPWPPGMGLQFEPLDASSLERLRQIISYESTRWAGA